MKIGELDNYYLQLEQCWEKVEIHGCRNTKILKYIFILFICFYDIASKPSVTDRIKN